MISGFKTYLDHAAATPLDPLVLKAMFPWLRQNFTNPSSIYKTAQQARSAIDEARNTVASIINAKPDEIFFTAGGSEANNWAIFGTANALNKKHIITTQIEHHSLLHPVQELQRRGYNITYLKVDRFGHVSLRGVQNALTPDTLLVSIMYANNETGTIENIEAIGKITRAGKILFHSDACQAAGFLNLNVNDLQVDLMSLNAGKIYGPKGTGALFVRKGVKITPLIYGGGQEHRLRAGTENVAGIVGFAEALKIADRLRVRESLRLKKLRDRLLDGFNRTIPGLKLNGHPRARLPNNLNISIPGIDGQSLLLRLDMAGICVSTGSACTSGSVEPSHVLLGLGLSTDLAKASLRLTLGRENNTKDIEKTLKILPKLVRQIKQNAT